MVRRRKTLQIWAAIVKLTLYSCFDPCFSTTVWFIIVSVMLYAISLAHTIAAVADIDIFSSIHNSVPVNNITESTEFIFAADWLYQCIRVSMGIQIIESIQMHAVDTVGRVARATVVVW